MAADPEKDSDLGSVVTAGSSSDDAVEIARDIFRSTGISNSYLIRGSGEDVAVNAGMFFEGPRIRERFAAVSDSPLRYLVFTQGHPDHIGGADALARPETIVVAQANYGEVRGYWNRLGEFYWRRSQTLWKSVLGEHSERPAVLAEPVPDELFRDRYAFESGGRRFELLSTSGGETTDSLVLWLPEERIVFTGNLFGPIFGHLPNLYTIRGDKIRSALRFVESADRVCDLGAELMVTGHGEPISGSGEIRDGITRIRDATQWLHDRTVDGMNAGTDLHTLMNDIRLPSELRVGQGHGRVDWCVRAVWEEYAGWFRFESTTELYPVPPRNVGADLVELAGADALTQRAGEHLSAKKPVEALHLSDLVLDSQGDHPGALAVRAAALELLLELSENENFSEVQWLRGRLEETRTALG